MINVDELRNKKYKDLCSVYSDEYFRLFNRRKI